MQEIDTMKYLLFNKEQLNLVNFISKPSVSLSNDNSDIYQQSLENNLSENTYEIEH